MKVLLLKDIKSVGSQGQIIEVSDGYGRNFLIPKGLAKFADSQTIQQFQEKKQQQRQNARIQKNLMTKLAKILNGQKFEFILPADEKGNLYAGLNEKQILDKIKRVYPDLPENARLVDYSNIKLSGNHLAKVRLGNALTANINIVIKTDT